MWTTSDTTAALVTARNQSQSLTDVKTGDTAGKPVASKTGQLLETLGAVIPTGVTALYTTVAIVVHQVALATGADERLALQTKLAEEGKKSSEVKTALDGLAQESDSYVGLRIALLVIAALVAFVMVYRAASAANQATKKKRRFVLAEPGGALVAFLGWSLASPGTPLGAFLSAGAMQVWTIAIAGITGLLLMGIGVELSKPATKAS